MGRKGRHSARTGDGGAEIRQKRKELNEATRATKAAELEFYDDPSENDQSGDDAESDGSHYGEEEEVLQIGEDDDEEESDDEDEEEAIDDDVSIADEDEMKSLLKMNSKWGNSKKTFYSADTAEFEADEDEEAAKDEEAAALELQRKQATLLDDEDFGMDVDDDSSDSQEEEEQPPVDDEKLLDDELADISMLADNGDMTSMEKVQKDFSNLSKHDKLRIVNQSAPELLGLIAELQSTLKELEDVVTPAILKLRDVRRMTKEYNTGMQYLVTRQNLMLNYVANISFYLLLRAEGKTMTDHPVLQHLLSLKKHMNKLTSVNDAVSVQLHELLTQEFPIETAQDEDDGMSQFFKQTNTFEEKQTPKPSKQKTVTNAEKEEAAAFYATTVAQKQALAQTKQQLYTHEKPELDSSDDDDEMEEGMKRGATYEIMKNRGLKAHKSKLNRNPRVKKRMQYRKAVIRRKGQVRDVRVNEVGRYGGETTGIKSNLTRSRKIRN